jgi:hypothetical protein
MWLTDVFEFRSHAFLQHPASRNYDWTGIKFLMSGAAPLTAALSEQVVKLLPVSASD